MGPKEPFATPGNTAYGRCSATHRWLFGLQRMTVQEGQRLWTGIYSRAFPRPARHIRAPARSAIYKGGPLLGLTGDRVFAGHVVFSSALGPGCLAAGMAGGAVRSRR